MISRAEEVIGPVVDFSGDVSFAAPGTRILIGDGVFLSAGHVVYEYDHLSDSNPSAISTSNIVIQNGFSDSFTVLSDYNSYVASYADQVRAAHMSAAGGGVHAPTNEQIEASLSLIAKDSVLISDTTPISGANVASTQSTYGLILFLEESDLATFDDILPGSSAYLDGYASVNALGGGLIAGGTVSTASGIAYYSKPNIKGDSGGALAISYGGNDYVAAVQSAKTVSTTLSAIITPSDFYDIHDVISDGQSGDVTVSEARSLVVGKADADTVSGTYRSDILLGRGGGDVLLDGDSLAGHVWANDQLFGGAGDDTLLAGSGDDLLHGGDFRNDSLGIRLALDADGIDTVDYGFSPFSGTVASGFTILIGGGTVPTWSSATYGNATDQDAAIYVSDDQPDPRNSIGTDALVSIENVTTGDGDDSVEIFSLTGTFLAGADKLGGLAVLDLGGQQSEAGDTIDVSELTEDVTFDFSTDDEIYISPTATVAEGFVVKGSERLVIGDGFEVSTKKEEIGNDLINIAKTTTTGSTIKHEIGLIELSLAAEGGPTVSVTGLNTTMLGSDTAKTTFIGTGAGAKFWAGEGGGDFTLLSGDSAWGYDGVVDTFRVSTVAPAGLSSAEAIAYLETNEVFIGNFGAEDEIYVNGVKFDGNQVTGTRDEYFDHPNYDVPYATTLLSGTSSYNTSYASAQYNDLGAGSLGSYGIYTYSAGNLRDVTFHESGSEVVRNGMATPSELGVITFTSRSITPQSDPYGSHGSSLVAYTVDALAEGDEQLFINIAGFDNGDGGIFFDNDADADALDRFTPLTYAANVSARFGEPVEADYSGPPGPLFSELRPFDGEAAPRPTGLALGSNSGQTFMATDDNDTFFGRDGNEVVYGFGGANVLHGGAGDDTLIGGDSEDTLFGGTGDDTLEGRGDFDTLDGGEGSDTAVYAGTFSDYLIQSGGDGFFEVEDLVGDEDTDELINIEVLQFNGDNRTISTEFFGTRESDNLSGTGQDDVILGFRGDDTLEGFEGDDLITGGRGDDVIDGGQGTDTAQFYNDQSEYTITHYANGTVVVSFDSGGGESAQSSSASPIVSSLQFPGFPGFPGFTFTIDDGTDTLTNVEFLEFGTASANEPTTTVAVASLPIAPSGGTSSNALNAPLAFTQNQAQTFEQSNAVLDERASDYSPTLGEEPVAPSHFRRNAIASLSSVAMHTMAFDEVMASFDQDAAGRGYSLPPLMRREFSQGSHTSPRASSSEQLTPEGSLPQIEPMRIAKQEILASKGAADMGLASRMALLRQDMAAFGAGSALDESFVRRHEAHLTLEYLA
jgi:Ca2+-binding RTX toxin-like protein